ncbi:sensor histidine kinase [Lentzea cavernae]|uniref:histidine kinase n=1 Tax=Lentzea cavernae TaxID=2020703 RepID=A0ABQ3MWQ0_9PSEU|nr:histidine kinase [Lentzea cavernae]GHH61282.1 hypothetical protein GCM10017774_87000 [Lentzea cavernae]
MLTRLREALAGAGFALLHGESPRVPQKLRLLTMGSALLGLVLNAFPSRMTAAHPAAMVWSLGILSVLPVLLCFHRPLLAWRSSTILLAVLPFLQPGLAAKWGWPWMPGLVLAAAVVLYVVAESNAQPVLVWVYLVTLGVVALHVRDWRDFSLAGAIALGVLVLGSTRRSRYIAEAERGEQERRRVQEEIRAATLEERALIARELHDVVAHHMSVLALRADSARYRFPGLSEQLRAEFVAMQETAREGMTEMRRLLGVLRATDGSTERAPQPGVGQIEELAGRLRDAGVDVVLDVRLGDTQVPAGVALSAYRITQEALSNAVRHAAGAAVDVSVRASAAELRVRVHNTRGEETLAGNDDRARHGLLGMRERVTALGGMMIAAPQADGGFLVEVSVPLNSSGVAE